MINVAAALELQSRENSDRLGCSGGGGGGSGDGTCRLAGAPWTKVLQPQCVSDLLEAGEATFRRRQRALGERGGAGRPAKRAAPISQ